MRLKVHCLEGRSATGQRYFACGKTGGANGTNHVGIARKDEWLRITCMHCQRAIMRRYGVLGPASP